MKYIRQIEDFLELQISDCETNLENSENLEDENHEQGFLDALYLMQREIAKYSVSSNEVRKDPPFKIENLLNNDCEEAERQLAQADIEDELKSA